MNALWRVVRGPSGLVDCVEGPEGQWFDARGEQTAKLVVEAVNSHQRLGILLRALRQIRYLPTPDAAPSLAKDALRRYHLEGAADD